MHKNISKKSSVEWFIALTGDFIFIPVTCGVRSEYRLFKENQMNFNFHKTNFFELH